MLSVEAALVLRSLLSAQDPRWARGRRKESWFCPCASGQAGSRTSTPFVQLTAGQVALWLFLAPWWEGLTCTWAASAWDSSELPELVGHIRGQFSLCLDWARSLWCCGWSCSSLPTDGERWSISAGPSPKRPRGAQRRVLGCVQPPWPRCAGSSMGGNSSGGWMVLTVRKGARWRLCLSSAALFYTNTIFQTCTLGRDLASTAGRDVTVWRLL